MGARRAARVGKLAGAEAIALGRRRPTSTRPSCARFDRYGHRIDEVEFHPGVAPAACTRGVEHGLHAVALGASRAPARTWRARPRFYMLTQAEAGLRLPDLDDLLGGAGAARDAGAGRARGSRG